jgi:hypothetical protein
VPPLLSAERLSPSFPLEVTTQNAMSVSAQKTRHLQSPFIVVCVTVHLIEQ